MLLRAQYDDYITAYLKVHNLRTLNLQGIIENVPESEIFVDDKINPSGVLVKSSSHVYYIYSESDSFICEAVHMCLRNGLCVFAGTEKFIVNKLKKHIDGIGCVKWEHPINRYYMPSERLNMGLIRHNTEIINLKDARVVDYYYTYRSSKTLKTITNDIERRPTSAVYVNGEIVCWVLVHSDGSMGILYCKESYRRNGYAVDVTIDLASKLINMGKVPFIEIVEGNGMSPGVASKCGFVELGEASWIGIEPISYK